LLFYDSCALRALRSFPTRRSSDLKAADSQLRMIADAVLQRAALRTLTSTNTAPSSFNSEMARRRAASVSAWTRSKKYSVGTPMRSEEHTSELQSRGHLVCRLLLEK